PARASVAPPPRRLGRESQECLNGRACLATCLQLKHLSQQYERHNHRRSLEVHGYLTARATKRTQEQTREKGRRQAIEIRDSGAHSDQREHIEIAAEDRFP